MISYLLQLVFGEKKNKNVIKVFKMQDDVQMPTKGSQHSAGYDLHAHEEEKVIEPGKRSLIDTGLKITVPEGCYGRIAPRSGLSYKNCIDVGAGVIDRDYVGEVKVLLINNGEKPFVVRKGDRIAQLICEKISYADIEQVQTLDDTSRGSGGFGSTGQ